MWKILYMHLENKFPRYWDKNDKAALVFTALKEILRYDPGS